MYLNPQALTVSAPQHCVNELLLHGADVTRTNINGESAVALAVNCRSVQAQGRKLKCIVVIFGVTFNLSKRYNTLFSTSILSYLKNVLNTTVDEDRTIFSRRCSSSMLWFL